MRSRSIFWKLLVVGNSRTEFKVSAGFDRFRDEYIITNKPLLGDVAVIPRFFRRYLTSNNFAVPLLSGNSQDRVGVTAVVRERVIFVG